MSSIKCPACGKYDYWREKEVPNFEWLTHKHSIYVINHCSKCGIYTFTTIPLIAVNKKFKLLKRENEAWSDYLAKVKILSDNKLLDDVEVEHEAEVETVSDNASKEGLKEEKR